ncbi:uncharacterized protein STAUR_1031 [Stigmatella aurantiaca DW4/3-1]|uniref:Uncharacterized protein n=1 Tax=Stigmatella aurantiaca (strain DW4/3-1) TaxID=378806 RepID=E3FDF6_STIAD|nr:uncharacterized protein STAUR_1031 [Stigmatella aurantiaca DW4/3-1]
MRPLIEGSQVHRYEHSPFLGGTWPSPRAGQGRRRRSGVSYKFFDRAVRMSTSRFVWAHRRPACSVALKDTNAGAGALADGGPVKPVGQPYQFVPSAPRGDTSNQPVLQPYPFVQSAPERGPLERVERRGAVCRGKSGMADAGGSVRTGGPTPRRVARDLRSQDVGPCSPSRHSRVCAKASSA